MKKLYMFIIIIFSIFVVSDVNALENFSLSDFVLSDSINFSNQPGTKTGTVLDWNGTELNNVPTNDYNYIILTLQSFIMYNETNTNSGNSYGYTSGNIIHCTPSNSNTPSSSYTCDYTVTQNTYMQQETHQVINLTLYGYVNYDNGGQHNCMYDGSNFVCPYEKGKRIINVSFKAANMSYGISMSARIGITYFYANLINSQSIINSIDNQTNQQQQQYQGIMNSNNSTNQSDFISFATNYFINDTTGTKSFLNIVPNFLNQLNNGTCTPLTLTIPFISKNNELTIPCMVGFLTDKGFGNLITIYQFVLSFIVAYWLTVNWFKLFKETIDPFNYRIEVMDL